MLDNRTFLAYFTSFGAFLVLSFLLFLLPCLVIYLFHSRLFLPAPAFTVPLFEISKFADVRPCDPGDQQHVYPSGMNIPVVKGQLLTSKSQHISIIFIMPIKYFLNTRGIYIYIYIYIYI